MDDWDTVTKIGKSVNRGGGGPRETVIRGKSALNAAQRSGAVVATEKKYTTGNLSSKPGVDGQKLAKVDRETDTGKIEVLSLEVRTLMEQARGAIMIGNAGMTRIQLANLSHIDKNKIQAFENGKAHPSQQEMAKIENVLNVKLRGKDIGQPKFPKK